MAGRPRCTQVPMKLQTAGWRRLLQILTWSEGVQEVEEVHGAKGGVRGCKGVSEVCGGRGLLELEIVTSRSSAAAASLAPAEARGSALRILTATRAPPQSPSHTADMLPSATCRIRRSESNCGCRHSSGHPVIAPLIVVPSGVPPPPPLPLLGLLAPAPCMCSRSVLEVDASTAAASSSRMA